MNKSQLKNIINEINNEKLDKYYFKDQFYYPLEEILLKMYDYGKEINNEEIKDTAFEMRAKLAKIINKYG